MKKVLERNLPKLPKKYFQYTLNYLMLDKDSFFQIVDSFRQDHIWKKKDNQYHLRRNVNLDGIDD